MSIQISEKMVVVLGSVGVSLPLSNVECQKGFVGVGFGCSMDTAKMFCEVLAEKSVEFFTKKMSATVTLAESG